MSTDTSKSPDTGASACASDPHDHTGHDHPPSGADIVRALLPALSIQALVLPGLGVLLLLAILAFAPSTPLVLLLGVSLGALQLLSLVVSSIFVARTRARLAVSPGLMAVRSSVEEILRLAAVLTAVLIWPADVRGDLAIWVGSGAALVWVLVAIVQTVRARRRIASPSDWSKDAVSTFVESGISVRRSMIMRTLEVIGTIAFHVGATVLVMLSPLMVVGTAVLSIGSGLSTLVLQRRPARERASTPWALAPLGIGLLTLGLAALALNA